MLSNCYAHFMCPVYKIPGNEGIASDHLIGSARENLEIRAGLFKARFYTFDVD